MKGLKYNTVYKYIVSVRCEGPLHIGAATGGQEDVLIHPVTGMPFVPGSGITGALRNYCRGTRDDKVTGLLFGSEASENPNDQSRLRNSDGLFTGQVKMELRPHVNIDRITGTVSNKNGSGQKFNMEYVGAGAEFEFTAYLYTDDDTVYLKDELEGILAGIKSGDIQFGAKKSNGGGQLSLTGIKFKQFDLRTPEDRGEWAIEDELQESCYTDYADRLPESVGSTMAYRITLSGKTEGYIQVKGIAVNESGKGTADSENIKNAHGDYIIPGSSLKGAIKTQMERIAGYLNMTSLIRQSFGTENTPGQETAITGNLVFYDTVIGDRESIDRMPLSNRIHIDKFTGGVLQGPFSEKNAAGEMELHIGVLDKNNPNATLALLIFALRDLGIQAMSLGGGYSVGKGIIMVEHIDIESLVTGNTAQIKFGKAPEIIDDGKIIESAICALKEARE